MSACCPRRRLANGSLWRARDAIRLAIPLLPLILAASAETRGDTIILRQEDGDTRQIRGTILDLTGERLVVQRPGVGEETIDRRRLLEFRTAWPESLEAARQAYADGEFERAAGWYSEALKAESRRWAQREILAEMIRCYRRLDNLPRAAELAGALYRDDSSTPHLDTAPILWWSQVVDPAAQRTARSWLEDEPALLRLIGASWLLGTDQSQEAEARLQHLASDRDPRIARLAQAQLWRRQIAQATLEQTRQWQQLLSGLPGPLQSGPRFVLAQALERLDEPQEAVLQVLRCPLLYSEQYDLAAESLLAAAGWLANEGDRQAADRLLGELVRRFSASRAAERASEILKRDG